MVDGYHSEITDEFMRWTNEYDLQGKTSPTICTHHKLIDIFGAPFHNTLHVFSAKKV